MLFAYNFRLKVQSATPRVINKMILNMMDRYLFICSTEIQIVSMLNIIDKGNFHNVQIDVVVCDRVAEPGMIAGLRKLEAKRVIDTVFFSECFSNTALERPYLKNYLRSKKIRQSVSLITAIAFTLKIGRKRYYQEKLQTFGNEFIEHLKVYKRVYYSGYKSLIASSCSYPGCEFHAIDEGIGSYLEGALTGKVNQVHLYEPDFCCYRASNDIKINQMSKVSLERIRLMEWIKIVFDCSCEVFDYHNKVLFFDQWQGERDLKAKRRLVLQAARKKLIDIVSEEATLRGLGFEIRHHPNTYNGTVSATRSQKLPFEIQLLLDKKEVLPDCCVTISSSAAVYWSMMLSLNKTLKIMILQPLFEELTEREDRTLNVYEFFKKISSKLDLVIIDRKDQIGLELNKLRCRRE